MRPPGMRHALPETNGCAPDGHPGAATGAAARPGAIIHDLRGPLGSITLQAELLVECLQHPPIPSIATLEQSAARIRSAAKRIEMLLSELAASIDGDRAEVKPEPTMVDASRLVTNSIELATLAAAARGIVLQATLEDDRPLCADAMQLQRVVENLVNNAIEAIGRGPGVVHVRVSARSPGWVRISVEDSGPGLRGRLDAIRPFHTTKGGHGGLGLAIAGEIVNAHGGRIVTRPRLPHGAIFDIDLPRYGPPGRNGRSKLYGTGTHGGGITRAAAPRTRAARRAQ